MFRTTFLTIFSLIGLCAGRTLAAPPELEHEDLGGNWIAKRSLHDPGKWDETAVRLHRLRVSELPSQSGVDYEVKGEIITYRHVGNKHQLQARVHVHGTVEERGALKGKRLNVKLKDANENEIAGLSMWNPTKSNAKKHRRISLRLYPQHKPGLRIGGEGDLDEPCDEPPDDDILEEEPDEYDPDVDLDP